MNMVALVRVEDCGTAIGCADAKQLCENRECIFAHCRVERFNPKDEVALIFILAVCMRDDSPSRGRVSVVAKFKIVVQLNL